MGFKKNMLFLVFLAFSASSLAKRLASSSDEQGTTGGGIDTIHITEHIAHGHGSGGGSGGVAANGGGSSGGTRGYGQSGARAAQGGTSVIPVYAATRGGNNNRHHSGSSHNMLGLATLFGSSLAFLGMALFLAFQ